MLVLCQWKNVCYSDIVHYSAGLEICDNSMIYQNIPRRFKSNYLKRIQHHRVVCRLNDFTAVKLDPKCENTGGLAFGETA